MSTTKIVFKFVSFTMIMEVYKFTLDDNNACVSEGGNQSTDMKPTRQICHHIGYHHRITVVRGMSVVAWLPTKPKSQWWEACLSLPGCPIKWLQWLTMLLWRNKPSSLQLSISVIYVLMCLCMNWDVLWNKLV